MAGGGLSQEIESASASTAPATLAGGAVPSRARVFVASATRKLWLSSATSRLSCGFPPPIPDRAVSTWS